jgi:putative transposase
MGGGMRNPGLAVGEVYHVYTKSIAKFKIFNTANDFERMRLLICLCRSDGVRQRLSWLIKTGSHRLSQAIEEERGGNRHVQLVAYCIMQTHLHLLVRQIAPDGISRYMSRMLNAYTRFFNTKYNRKGPLWESRFQGRLIETTDDMLHMTRYIHLNPATAKLVQEPSDWKYSSYGEYVGTVSESEKLCEFRDLVDLSPAQYEKFVKDRIDYQRTLARLKQSVLGEDDFATP